MAKNRRARLPRQQAWALSIVDTSTVPAKGDVCIFNNRKFENILPIISKIVRSASVTHNDKFRSYIGLSNNQKHIHRTDCHKHNFVDRTTSVHTQAVVSFNSKIKLFIVADATTPSFSNKSRAMQKISFLGRPWEDINPCEIFCLFLEKKLDQNVISFIKHKKIKQKN